MSLSVPTLSTKTPHSMWYFILVCIFLAILVLCFLFSRLHSSPHRNLCFSSWCVTLEYATTDQQRQEGLMFRSALPEDAGMLFVFDTDGVYPFWMKNTHIPLDMIWLDEDLTVVDVVAHAAPCVTEKCPTYGGVYAARYVLEVPAGMALRHGIEKGSKALFAGR